MNVCVSVCVGSGVGGKDTSLKLFEHLLHGPVDPCHSIFLYISEHKIEKQMWCACVSEHFPLGEAGVISPG